MERLLQHAYDHDIGYTLTRKLDSRTPSFAQCEKRRMFINMNWYNHDEIPFSIAHEMGHIENGDVGELYYSPGSFKSKYERAANLKALEMIFPIYVDANQGMIPHNYQTVMDQLQIPQCLENDVRAKFAKIETD
ncbi:ImmA/IrrE family metallo-endopeptidase [Lactiplantibacillus xiangfangensis]|uniref:ImmA/IrrE family metallo-endopeptidase n=1 Tax=Lactiplantibacillus xiangfangensis TaxID=942150 RepID=UPI00384CE8DA